MAVLSRPPLRPSCPRLDSDVSTAGGVELLSPRVHRPHSHTKTLTTNHFGPRKVSGSTQSPQG